MKKENIFYTAGLLMIAAAMALTVHNLLEDRQAGSAARDALAQFDAVLPVQDEVPAEAGPKELLVELPEYVIAPMTPMPVREINGVEYVGRITIPALSLELPVAAQWSYDNLNIAPCLYSGTIYQGNMVLCGHNFTTHFGGLRNLHLGDDVIFTDMDGNEFRTVVGEILILPSTAAEEMTSGEWDLTLFTCDFNRSNRVTIRCSLFG